MTRSTTRPTSSGRSELPGSNDPARPRVRPARVAVVGIHGHGSTHVRNALSLQEHGKCRLVGVADLRPPDAGTVGPDVGVFTDLESLLAVTDVDIVVVCTPIHTHRQLAEAAMRAGADVLLEKPPVPTMAEFEHLLALCVRHRPTSIARQARPSGAGDYKGSRRKRQRGQSRCADCS